MSTSSQPNTTDPLFTAPHQSPRLRQSMVYPPALSGFQTTNLASVVQRRHRRKDDSTLCSPEAHKPAPARKAARAPCCLYRVGFVGYFRDLSIMQYGHASSRFTFVIHVLPVPVQHRRWPAATLLPRSVRTLPMIGNIETTFTEAPECQSSQYSCPRNTDRKHTDHSPRVHDDIGIRDTHSVSCSE